MRKGCAPPEILASDGRKYQLKRAQDVFSSANSAETGLEGLFRGSLDAEEKISKAPSGNQLSNQVPCCLHVPIDIYNSEILCSGF